MSASTRTHSPTTRFIAKRPPSTSGSTPSITTRLLPSCLNEPPNRKSSCRSRPRSHQVRWRDRSNSPPHTAITSSITSNRPPLPAGSLPEQSTPIKKRGVQQRIIFRSGSSLGCKAAIEGDKGHSFAGIASMPLSHAPAADLRRLLLSLLKARYLGDVRHCERR